MSRARTGTALQPMRWWHIDPVMRLERALFTDDAWTETMFWSELAEHESRHYVVAVDHDAVVGYAGLCAYPSGEAYVQTIGVDPAHRRAGIGAALLADLLDEAQRRGCVHVDLEVRAGNDDAIRLYERHGFREIGLRKGYYQPSGADAVVMRRGGAP
ncbi:MAG TPA: ribosomal protein S18-alanine N-acetyltransferase [Mycobacteriales bacterium]|nr:ribosomal protein S18-alanine N-acetyltransferase [Mycobacteriales bacterium]